MSKNFIPTPDQKQALNLLGGTARQTLLFGGSRSGKTFILIYAVLVRALREPGSRHIILRFRANAVRQSVRLDTFPKVLRLAFPGVRFEENRADGFVRFHNGSEIWFGGLDTEERVDKILGREFATIYFNECSEIAYNTVTTALTRLAQRTNLTNRAYFDCNPSGKSHWSYRLFLEKVDPLTLAPLAAPDQYAAMLMNPAGNAANLPAGYLEETLANLPELQRKRFMLGEFLDDLEGALWNAKLLAGCRADNLPVMERIVIGVDPAVTSGQNSDTTGIIAAGRGTDGVIYILKDASIRAKPQVWGRRVVDLYHELRADRVVGEVNNGGDLVEELLRSFDDTLPFRAVRASRGKTARAEPVAALYEQQKVRHHGIFPELEEEMCSFLPGSPFSPDRMDAMVWAVTELTRSGGNRHIFA